MRTLFIVLLTVFFSFSFHIQAQKMDMSKYLNDTNNIAAKGNYKEALKRHIWFHNNALKYAPSMSGVRLSFALGYWKELGEKYPPAMKALKDIRNAKTKLVEDGKASFEIFHDVSAINRTLDEKDKTFQLFLMVDKKYPAKAKKYWIIVDNDFIDAKRYDIVRKYIKNISERYDRLKMIYSISSKNFDNPKMGPRYKKFCQQSFVKNVTRLIKVAVALGKEKEAKEIKAKALKVIDSEKLRKVPTSK